MTNPDDKKLANGQGLDRSGDPTANVIALNAAANLRQDDLREAAKELSDAKIDHQKELGDLRASHQKEISDLRAKHQSELGRAESERLDSIRQVDREDVNKTATQANNAIAALAAATTTTAETLRGQVATTAQAAATSLANSMGEVNKRLSALELSSSEGKGKQTIADPMQVELVQEMKRVTALLAGGAGEKTGKVSQQQMMMMVVSLIVAMFVIGGFVVGIAYAIRS